MKKKKLNRDGWGFQLFPYYQMRVDCDEFHGLACVIKLLDGESQYWETPKAGRIQVAGKGVTWLQLIPDGKKRVITVKYFPDGTQDEERKHYPTPADERYRPSIWYVDVIDGMEYDENGVAVYIDKYLDVIFTPEGDVVVDDRDELDESYANGELTKEQYEEALAEGEDIQKELCFNIAETDRICAIIRSKIEERIKDGELPFFVYHASQYDFEKVKPMPAHGQCERESLLAIYAAASAKNVIPFALPIRCYPDSPEGKRSFECDGGKTRIIYGSLDPNGIGYIYKMKSDSFKKIDDWQFVSSVECDYVEKITVNVKDFMHTVTFSEEARKIQEKLYPVSDEK